MKIKFLNWKFRIRYKDEFIILENDEFGYPIISKEIEEKIKQNNGLVFAETSYDDYRYIISYYENFKIEVFGCDNGWRLGKNDENNNYNNGDFDYYSLNECVDRCNKNFKNLVTPFLKEHILND
jgi:hypothetical protein